MLSPMQKEQTKFVQESGGSPSLLLASRSSESQARIQEMVDELLLESQLHLIREDLEISQKELAAALGIKQPSLSVIENRGNDLSISTMKKYVEAMGGKLRIDVELPTENTQVSMFNIKKMGV